MNKLKEIGKKLFKKGQPEIGKAVIRTAGKVIKSHPVGSVLDSIGILDGLGRALGVDPDEDSIIEAIDSMTPEQLAAHTKLEEFKRDIQIAELEAESSAIESVNETIRQEVIGNPAAGEWRPMWGRWTCRGFWIGLGFIGALAATDLIAFEGARFILHLPTILTAFAGVLLLPASILGVASYHRGQEKKILAGEK